ncbi:hypothetical protein ASPWEDRAFT_45184 [Aspergillus wentii DTO 134E9]|uniref:Uncharacterized protein n=1 Tax=Aspergillus wentii DTO 134E9 TaxID=1073089 RepID=A0A1L9R8H1_ASPWE|nr:uncharacterized protein ASPWEDRAFT_45184 [Aspergillus wentii DTO 134E9]OJJ31222.1 hypothetical protein ASPWEDRAFT_45184 [Aspergillus wentii DTO 134E9]
MRFSKLILLGAPLLANALPTPDEQASSSSDAAAADYGKYSPYGTYHSYNGKRDEAKDYGSYSPYDTYGSYKRDEDAAVKDYGSYSPYDTYGSYKRDEAADYVLMEHTTATMARETKPRTTVATARMTPTALTREMKTPP